jgi:hypothetical protein
VRCGLLQPQLVGRDEEVFVLKPEGRVQLFAQGVQFGLQCGDIELRRDIGFCQHDEVFFYPMAIEVGDVDFLGGAELAHGFDDARMIRPDDGENESTVRFPRRSTVHQRPADYVQARIGFGDLSGERLAGGEFGEAGDHDEREISADDGLATGVDISIASANGRTECSDNARMIIGEHMVYDGMRMLSMHAERIASAALTFKNWLLVASF